MLNHLAGWWIKKVEKTNQATYLALAVAHNLEQYVHTCLSAADDHDNAENSYGNVGAYVNKLPTLPSLPDEDFRVFAIDLLDDLFDFQQRVSFANESLEFAFQILDGEEAIEQGYKSCLELAREALQIADSVRHRYGLKGRPLEFGGYSVRKRLNKKLEQMKQ